MMLYVNKLKIGLSVFVIQWLPELLFGEVKINCHLKRKKGNYEKS